MVEEEVSTDEVQSADQSQQADYEERYQQTVMQVLQIKRALNNNSPLEALQIANQIEQQFRQQ